MFTERLHGFRLLLEWDGENHRFDRTDVVPVDYDRCSLAHSGTVQSFQLGWDAGHPFLVVRDPVKLTFLKEYKRDKEQNIDRPSSFLIDLDCVNHLR